MALHQKSGGVLVAGGDTTIVGVVALVLAVLGYLASRAVPHSPPSAPDLRIDG